MPKTLNTAQRGEPARRTRSGHKRPRVPKAWFGRAHMRELAKVLERMAETLDAFDIRQAIRAQKRCCEGRPHFKAIRERRAAEAASRAARQARTAGRARDGKGRFLPA